MPRIIPPMKDPASNFGPPDFGADVPEVAGCCVIGATVLLCCAAVNVTTALILGLTLAVLDKLAT